MFQKIGKIRNDIFDTELFAFARIFETGIQHENVSIYFHEVHVLAIFVKTAKCH